MKMILKESHLRIITYLQVAGRPGCGRDIIAIAAVDAIDVMVGST